MLKKTGKYLLLVLLAPYPLIRSFYLDAVPRWDAHMYFDGLVTAVTSLRNVSRLSDLPSVILNTFNVWGHPSMGYYSILVLGQLIDFPNQTILNLTNLGLALACIYWFYKILRQLFPQDDRLPEIALASAAFAFDPLFFASSIFLNTDFPLLVFLSAALHCLFQGRYGWFCVSCLFLVFSKAPGLVFYASIIGPVLAYAAWIFARRAARRKKPDLRDFFLFNGPGQVTSRTAAERLLCLALPGVLMGAYLIARKGNLWALQRGPWFDSNGWNCFGFNSRIVKNRAGEIFVLDFHWVATLILGAAWVIGILRRLRRPSPKARNSAIGPQLASLWQLSPGIAAFCAFVAFNLLYITYIVPRYVVEAGFFLVLGAFLALQWAIRSQAARVAALGALFALFFWQTFRTVDPLSKALFGSAPFGSHEILQIEDPGQAVGNGFVYNSEYTLIDKLFNLMQKEMPLRPDTRIMTWDKNDWYPYITPIYVNARTLERTIDWRNAFHYNVLDITELKAENAPPEAFYVYMPWMSVLSNEHEELAKLRALYEVSEPKQVGFQGYYLTFYKVVRRSEVDPGGL